METETSTKLQLSVRAEDLKNIAGLFKGTSDPYCSIAVTGGVHDGSVVGRTETVDNDLSPDWCAVFILNFWSPGQYTPLTVSIFDDMSSKGVEDKLMGEANFEVTEVISSPGRERSECLRSGGSVYLHIDESIKGDACGRLTLQMRGIDVLNVESGILGLGKSDPFFEVSKKLFDHTSGVTRWKPVYRSEHVKDNHNPFWKSFSIGLEEFCFCDLEWPLRISVIDHEKGGKRNRMIGSFETTLRGLMNRVAVRGNADRENSFEIYALPNKRGEKVGAGRMCVLAAKVIT